MHTHIRTEALLLAMVFTRSGFTRKKKKRRIRRDAPVPMDSTPEKLPDSVREVIEKENLRMQKEKKEIERKRNEITLTIYTPRQFRVFFFFTYNKKKNATNNFFL